MAQDSTREQPEHRPEGGPDHVRRGPGWGKSQRGSRGNAEGPGGASNPGIRLQRVLADAGVASRRDCEAMIEAGRVSVNGQMVRVLPVFVDPETDRIEVDGRVVGKPERRLYLLLNKPERVLTTVDDSSEFAGTGTARMTVLDLVDHPAKARLFPVGRLDFATRGLVLLTNDGELANKLTHPRYEVPKVYEAVVKGSVSDEQLAELRKLVSKQERQDARKKSDGPAAGPRPAGPRVRSRAEVELIDSAPGETTIRLVLRERTGYPLRKIIVAAGCPVKKLTRVALGPLELTGVREGQWRELSRAELMLLRRDPRRAPAKIEDRTEQPRSGGPAWRGRGTGGPAKSGPIKSGRGKPGSVGSGPVRSGPVRSGPVRSGSARSGPMKSGPNRSGPSRPDASGPDQARSGPRRPNPQRPSSQRPSSDRPSSDRPRRSGPGAAGPPKKFTRRGPGPGRGRGPRREGGDA